MEPATIQAKITLAANGMTQDQNLRTMALDLATSKAISVNNRITLGDFPRVSSDEVVEDAEKFYAFLTDSQK